jgi:hypothetical protein
MPQTPYIIHAGLELTIILPHPPEYWDYITITLSEFFNSILFRCEVTLKIKSKALTMIYSSSED